MPPLVHFYLRLRLIVYGRDRTGFGRKLMKAIVYYNYGSLDVLQYEEIDKPAAGDNEVLIKVRAASINPLDCGSLKGLPYIFRIVFGLDKPTVIAKARASAIIAH